MFFKRRIPFIVLALSAVGLISPVSAASSTASQNSANVSMQPNGARTPAIGQVRYIVEFQPGIASTSIANDVAKAHGGSLVRTFVNVLNGAVIDIPAQALSALATNPNVVSVERDAEVQATQVVSVQQSSPPWGLDRLDQRDLPLTAATTYDPPSGASGVRAFIIDTGIYNLHSEFGQRVVSGFDAVTTGGNGWNDCNGHGTHVAGTVGGATYGVAKAVTLVPVRVLDCAGSGTNSGVIAGLDWVASQHTNQLDLDVANMSLGGGASSALDTALTNLIKKGVTVVVAAGNSNANACNYSPARVPAAITVAASDISDTRASFSNYGSCVDVFAPGVGITSSVIGSTTLTATWSGTSMASPHVAGVAAMILAMQTSQCPSQVAASLISNATQGKIVNAGINTPNRLVFIDPAGATTSTTLPGPCATEPFAPAQPVASPLTKAATVTWTVPADGGSPITSQTVRAFSGATLFKTVTTTATTKTLSVTGLRTGVSYTFTVSATNANGAGAQSIKSNAVTPR